jgi:hypothetical protein
VVSFSHLYNPANPPVAFSTSLQVAPVDLTHGVFVAIGRGLVSSGFTFAALGIHQGTAGEITHFLTPHVPAGSLAMVAHAGHAALNFLQSAIPGGASGTYLLGQERALKFALDCLNTFASAAAIYQPTLEPIAIMGWVAELFIRGQILVPPAPGALGNPLNTDPCAQHVLRTMLPAVQQASQARTLALVQESTAATALLYANFAKERDERATRDAAREVQRAKDRASWESSKAAAIAPSRRTKADGSSKPRDKAAKCYYADDSEKDTVVDYKKVCPYHGPGHKADKCNVLLKTHGGLAETLNPRYKDLKFPKDGKSYAASSKCEYPPT